MVTLEEWFGNKDYGIGLALLAGNCANRQLIKSLSRKSNPAKLEYELNKIARAKGLTIPVEEAPELMTPHITEAHTAEGTVLKDADHSDKGGTPGKKIINPDELPEVLRLKWHENNDCYKEIRSLHEKLKLMEKATDQDRAPLVKRIADLDDTIRANWEAIDTWALEPDMELEPGKIYVIDHKRINANRKFISTSLKALPVMASEANKGILIAKVQQRVDELLSAGEMLEPDTLEKLKKAGIQC